MDALLKTQWIEALRSGKYKQSRNKLKVLNTLDNTVSYCCLGVLYEVIGADWRPRKKCGNQIVYEVENCNGEEELQRLNSAGLGKDAHMIDGYDNQTTLWKLNDNDSYSFNQIADWIEDNIKGDTPLNPQIPQTEENNV